MLGRVEYNNFPASLDGTDGTMRRCWNQSIQVIVLIALISVSFPPISAALCFLFALIHYFSLTENLTWLFSTLHYGIVWSTPSLIFYLIVWHENSTLTQINTILFSSFLKFRRFLFTLSENVFLFAVFLVAFSYIREDFLVSWKFSTNTKTVKWTQTCKNKYQTWIAMLTETAI